MSWIDKAWAKIRIILGDLVANSSFQNRGMRKCFSDGEISEELLSAFGSDEALAAELWYEIASILEVDKGVIRLDDRLSDFSSPLDIGLTPNLDRLYFVGKKRSEVMRVSIDFSRINTVREYISAFL